MLPMMGGSPQRMAGIGALASSMAQPNYQTPARPAARRPGSGGVTYFSPMQYLKPGESPAVTNTQPTVTAPKPIISFITPPVNGHVVTVAPYKISAQILNVASANQIQFKFNGVAYTNFSFNAQTHILEYNSTLNNGSNAIQIVATNAGGQDNKSTTVVYDQPKPTVNPPIITYVNPAQPGAISSTQNYTVQAQVLNVTAQNQIAVYYNGMSTPFIYNATTKQIAFTANLNPGSNAVSITASNAGGVDTKTTTVAYNQPSTVVNPPIVTYINPVQAGYVSSVQNYTVKAKVLNVTAQNFIVINQPLSLLQNPPNSMMEL
jgi:hypothetical protein